MSEMKKNFNIGRDKEAQRAVAALLALNPASSFANDEGKCK